MSTLVQIHNTHSLYCVHSRGPQSPQTSHSTPVWPSLHSQIPQIHEPGMGAIKLLFKLCGNKKVIESYIVIQYGICGTRGCRQRPEWKNSDKGSHNITNILGTWRSGEAVNGGAVLGGTWVVTFSSPIIAMCCVSSTATVSACELLPTSSFYSAKPKKDDVICQEQM